MSEEFKPWGMEEKAYLMFMHLSQLVGFIVPFAGIIIPIVMWATNKDKSSEIDQHGRVIINWLISALIYAVIGFVLIFVVIGIFALLALAIASIVFAIVGAVKANENKLWAYPLSIKFLSVSEPSMA